MDLLKLQSLDGEVFTVDKRIIKCSKVMSEMCELKIVIEWAKYHENHSCSMEEEVRNGFKIYKIQPWDDEFLDVDMKTLLQVAAAAHFLEIPELVTISTQIITNKTKFTIKCFKNLKFKKPKGIGLKRVKKS